MIKDMGKPPSLGGMQGLKLHGKCYGGNKRWAFPIGVYKYQPMKGRAHLRVNVGVIPKLKSKVKATQASIQALKRRSQSKHMEHEVAEAHSKHKKLKQVGTLSLSLSLE